MQSGGVASSHLPSAMWHGRDARRKVTPQRRSTRHTLFHMPVEFKKSSTKLELVIDVLVTTLFSQQPTDEHKFQVVAMNASWG